MKKFVIAMIAVLAISGLSAMSTTAPAGSVPISQLNMDAVPSIRSGRRAQGANAAERKGV